MSWDSAHHSARNSSGLCPGHVGSRAACSVVCRVNIGSKLAEIDCRDRWGCWKIEEFVIKLDLKRPAHENLPGRYLSLLYNFHHVLILIPWLHKIHVLLSHPL